MDTKIRIAVDLPGTVISLTRGKMLPMDYNYGRSYLDVPSVDCSSDALAWLVRSPFVEELFLVAGIFNMDKQAQLRAQTWLSSHRIYERSGVKRDNVHFLTGNELDYEKNEADICKRLGITHFISHRLQSMECLTEIEHLFLLNPNLSDKIRSKSLFDGRIKQIPAWLDIFDYIHD